MFIKNMKTAVQCFQVGISWEGLSLLPFVLCVFLWSGVQLYSKKRTKDVGFYLTKMRIKRAVTVSNKGRLFFSTSVQKNGSLLLWKKAFWHICETTSCTIAPQVVSFICCRWLLYPSVGFPILKAAWQKMLESTRQTKPSVISSVYLLEKNTFGAWWSVFIPYTKELQITSLIMHSWLLCYFSCDLNVKSRAFRALLNKNIFYSFFLIV